MLQSIRLTNFKCFREQSLEVRPITLLSGFNGTGKSSMLQALLLLRQSHQQKLLPGRGLALNGSLISAGTAQDVFNRSAESESTSIELTSNEFPDADWEFEYDSRADVMKLHGDDVHADVYAQSAVFGDRFQYLSAERTGPRPSFAMADFAVRQQRQMGSRGEFMPHFLGVYGSDAVELEGVKHPDAAADTLIAQSEAWLGSISPGVRLEIEMHSSMDVVHMQYSFAEGRMISDPFRPTNVGFGLTYILPVIVAVLAARPGSLLLIENPEAHLHARGQIFMARLMGLAASCGVQLLIETHSEHILNGVRRLVHKSELAAENVGVHFFERRTSKAGVQHVVTSPQMDNDGRIDYWPEGFFDEWDRSLEVLLTPAE